jgi:hypothetical protein
VHDGDIVVYFDDDDEMKETRIVRELHGKEKSPEFQPPEVGESRTWRMEYGGGISGREGRLRC